MDGYPSTAVSGNWERSLPVYLTLEILAPCQWIRGSLKTNGGVLEELPGRLCLLGWVQLVLGSYVWGKSHSVCQTRAYYPLGCNCTSRGVIKVKPIVGAGTIG